MFNPWSTKEGITGSWVLPSSAINALRKAMVLTMMVIRTTTMMMMRMMTTTMIIMMNMTMMTLKIKSGEIR